MTSYTPQTKLTAIRHPFATLMFLMGRKHPIHEVMVLNTVRHLYGRDADLQPWRAALAEIERGDYLPLDVPPDVRAPSGNALRSTLGKWLYCVVRALRPESVIETGVANGVSSWTILNAMK